MCGRYNLRATPSEIQEFFDVFRMPEFDGRPRYNIAPTQMLPIVRAADDQRECVLARWGLIPFWSKDAKIGNRMINARSETVTEKPSFRAAVKHRRRCLVPTTGFYEWKKLHARNKQPYHIHQAGDGLFAFAGLWEHWDKGEQPVDTFTILTTEANSLMADLHDRMPVILSPDEYGVWLDPNVPTEGTVELMRPYPGEDLETDPVNKLVGNVRNDVPECVEPIA